MLTFIDGKRSTEKRKYRSCSLSQSVDAVPCSVVIRGQNQQLLFPLTFIRATLAFEPSPGGRPRSSLSPCQPFSWCCRGGHVCVLRVLSNFWASPVKAKHLSLRPSTSVPLSPAARVDLTDLVPAVQHQSACWFPFLYSFMQHTHTMKWAIRSRVRRCQVHITKWFKSNVAICFSG